MKPKKGFSRVRGHSQKPMYGPRALLVSGFEGELRERLTALLESLPFRNLQVVFAADADATRRVGDLLKAPEGSPPREPSGLPPAIVMSGVSEKELHMLMDAYRLSGLPRPLWASLTPTAESWPLSQLLTELEAERAALGRTSWHSP